MLSLYAPLEVRCPRCGGRATFEEPFEFLLARQVDAGQAEGMHRWGGWLVREKFPSVVRWKAPRGSEQYLTGGCPGGYRLRHRGVVRCRACHFVGVHVLRWPADAFFHWNVRGTPLWAWDVEHARVLLEYIGSLQRDPFRHGAYRRSLQKLPAAILAARSRETVSRKIRETLWTIGEPERSAQAG